MAETLSQGCAQLQASPVSVSAASTAVTPTTRSLITADFLAGETLVLDVNYSNSNVRVLFNQQVLIEIPHAIPLQVAFDGSQRRTEQVIFVVPASGTAAITLQFAGGSDSGIDDPVFDEFGLLIGRQPRPYTDTIAVALSCTVDLGATAAAIGRTADRIIDLAFDTTGSLDRVLGGAPAALFGLRPTDPDSTPLALTAAPWRWHALPYAGGAQVTGSRTLARDSAVWISGNYEGGRDDRGGSGLSKDGYALIGGIGRRLGNRASLGLVGRYRATELDSTPLAMNLDVDGLTAGAFVAVRPFAQLDTRWTTMLSYEDAEADLALRGASDELDVNLWTVASRLNHHLQFGHAWFEPTFTGEATRVERGAFSLVGTDVASSVRWRGNLGGGGRVGATFSNLSEAIGNLSVFGSAEGLWYFAEDSTGVQTDGTVLSQYGAGARFAFGLTVALRSLGVFGIDAGYQFAGDDTAQFTVGGTLNLPY